MCILARVETTYQELIRAIQAARAAAFETFYGWYRDWVAAPAYRFRGLPEGSVGMA